jgi:hypothetical protein
MKKQKIMKNTNQISILTRNTLSYLLFTMLILLSSCSKNEKDEEIPDCGKNGKIVFTITDSKNQIGYLYKNTDYSTTNYQPYYNYGVWFAEKNCSNCVHTFFVLNDSFLNNFGEIPPYPGVLVTFSGTAKKMCVNPVAPADYTYNFLTLTKITKQ